MLILYNTKENICYILTTLVLEFKIGCAKKVANKPVLHMVRPINISSIEP